MAELAKTTPVNKDYITPVIADYYLGVTEQFTGRQMLLLARSQNDNFVPPPAFKYKKICTIQEPQDIQRLMNPMLRAETKKAIEALRPVDKLISIDYLRIGHEENGEENPMLAFCTAASGMFSREDAKAFVDLVYKIHQRYHLADVHVEMTEAERSLAGPFILDFDGRQVFPEGSPNVIPCVGSSIALHASHKDVVTRTGTLGGFVEIEGEVFGLTNHHVLLGTPAQNPKRSDPQSKVVYDPPYTFNPDNVHVVNQPSDSDKDRHIEVLKATIEADKANQICLLPNTECKGYKRLAHLIEDREEDVMHVENFSQPLGCIYFTSGVRVAESSYEGFGNPSMDWGLIRLKVPRECWSKYRISEDRVSDYPENQLPNMSEGYFLNREYRNYAQAIENRKLQDMPNRLTHSLTWSETTTRNNKIRSDGYRPILFKVGSRTYFTFGTVNGVLTHYIREGSSLSSSEWCILDDSRRLREDDAARTFSSKGDSGAVLWNMDGGVEAMLWGGNLTTNITYATPIQFVLDDISKRLGGKEVRLYLKRENDS